MKAHYLVHLGNAVLVGAGAGVDPQVKWLQKSKGPVEVQVAEVPAVDVIQ